MMTLERAAECIQTTKSDKGRDLFSHFVEYFDLSSDRILMFAELCGFQIAGSIELKEKSEYADTFNIEQAKKAQLDFCNESSYPHFAPHSGICWDCRVQIYCLIPVERAKRDHITGCPCCYVSYCD